MDISDQIDPEKWKKFMKKQGKDEHGKPLEKIDVTVTQPSSSSSSSSDAPAASQRQRLFPFLHVCRNLLPAMIARRMEIKI